MKRYQLLGSALGTAAAIEPLTAMHARAAGRVAAEGRLRLQRRNDERGTWAAHWASIGDAMLPEQQAAEA